MPAQRPARRLRMPPPPNLQNHAVSWLLLDDQCSEARYLCIRILPGILSQTGFQTCLFEKSLGIPSVLRRNLWKQNTPFATRGDVETVLADLQAKRVFQRRQRRKHRDIDSDFA